MDRRRAEADEPGPCTCALGPALALSTEGAGTTSAPPARAAVASGNRISEITGLIALGRVRARRGDPGFRRPRRGACARAARRAPAATCTRARGACRGGMARRERRAGRRGGKGRLSARAREAPPLVRRRARVLAVEGRRARRAPEWIGEPYRLELAGAAVAAAASWRDRGARTRQRVRSPGRRTRALQRRSPSWSGSAQARRPRAASAARAPWPAGGGAGEPGGPDRPRAGGARPRRRGPAEPRDRRAARALATHGRPSRLLRPAQARGSYAGRGRCALPRNIGNRRAQDGRSRRCGGRRRP